MAEISHCANNAIRKHALSVTRLIYVTNQIHSSSVKCIPHSSKSSAHRSEPSFTCQRHPLPVNSISHLIKSINHPSKESVLRQLHPSPVKGISNPTIASVTRQRHRSLGNGISYPSNASVSRQTVTDAFTIDWNPVIQPIVIIRTVHLHLNIISVPSYYSLFIKCKQPLMQTF